MICYLFAFNLASDKHLDNIRYAYNGNLLLPKPRTKYLKRSLAHNDISNWNNLHMEVKHRKKDSYV